MTSSESAAQHAGQAIGLVFVLILMIPVIIIALIISAIIELVFIPLCFAKLTQFDKKKGIIMGCIYIGLLLIAILRFVLILTSTF